MTIDRFVAERILQPLGMVDSFYLSKADDPRKERVASVYIGSPGKWTRFWKPDGPPLYPFAWGSQTLYSTPADYARFLALWMDGDMVGDKRLLSTEAIARILTPASPMKSLGSDKPYPCGFFGMKPHYGQMSMLYAPGESPTQAEVTWGFRRVFSRTRAFLRIPIKRPFDDRRIGCRELMRFVGSRISRRRRQKNGRRASDQWNPF
jgi:CubicO group peptidase (beta-lactamase class C family)